MCFGFEGALMARMTKVETFAAIADMTPRR